MARLGSWIEPFPEGIYIKPADAWVDPGQPKARALVTHGHADHARGGHEEVLATAETLAIMECRYGPQPGGRPVAYGEVGPGRRGRGELRSRPATCSARPRSCSTISGERVVVSGDYKRRPDPTCAPFEPVPCDIFITEATFGLPVFRHPETASRDRPAAAPAPRKSRALRSGRRLCARQGAAADRRAALPGPSTTRSTSTARFSGCATSTASMASSSASSGRRPRRRRTS